MKITQFFHNTLGVKLRNARWSWGAIDHEANRVFLRVWKDEIQISRDGETVQVFWKDYDTASPGKRERMEHLTAIRNGAIGIGVVAVAVDPQTRGAREIESFDLQTLLELGEIIENKNDENIYAKVKGRIPINRLTEYRDVNPDGKAILQLLVKYIRDGRFVPGYEKGFLGYKEVHDELGWQKSGLHWGASLRQRGLASLALWLQQKQLPAITGLIVDQNNFEPGDGYYEAFGRVPNDRSWWVDQIKKSIAFDWSPYVQDVPAPTVEELLVFTKAINEGTLTTVVAAVRERCEALRRRAKQYYRSSDGKLRCEVCGWHKPDNRISGDIVELHHMRPLANLPETGVKLRMEDAIASLVPLCPCCHRIAHASRSDQRVFSLEELKSIIPKYACEKRDFS